MKQLAIAVLIAALISLGFRLAGGFRAGAASAEAGPADPASAARTRRSTEKRREVFIAWGSVRDRDCQIKHLDDDRLAESEKHNARNSFL